MIDCTVQLYMQQGNSLVYNLELTNQYFTQQTMVQKNIEVNQVICWWKCGPLTVLWLLQMSLKNQLSFRFKQHFFRLMPLYLQCEFTDAKKVAFYIYHKQIGWNEPLCFCLFLVIPIWANVIFHSLPSHLRWLCPSTPEHCYISLCTTCLLCLSH